MSDRNLTLHCRRHGEQPATLRCRHLPHGIHRGSFTATDAADPRPDAWCATCNALLREEGGWTPFADRYPGEAVVCAACYDAIKKRNRRTPLADERVELLLNRHNPTL